MGWRSNCPKRQMPQRDEDKEGEEEGEKEGEGRREAEVRVALKGPQVSSGVPEGTGTGNEALR